jgi:hypothetical protein
MLELDSLSGATMKLTTFSVEMSVSIVLTETTTNNHTITLDELEGTVNDRLLDLIDFLNLLLEIHKLDLTTILIDNEVVEIVDSGLVSRCTHVSDLS